MGEGAQSAHTSINQIEIKMHHFIKYYKTTTNTHIYYIAYIVQCEDGGAHIHIQNNTNNQFLCCGCAQWWMLLRSSILALCSFHTKSSRSRFFSCDGMRGVIANMCLAARRRSVATFCLCMCYARKKWGKVCAAALLPHAAQRRR